MTNPPSSSSTSSSSDSTTTPLQTASSFITLLLSNPSHPTYDTLFLKHLRLTSATLSSPSAGATATTVTARLTITPEMCNAMGRLHGGATATIFDLVTTLPIVVAARQRQLSPNREGGSWITAGVSRTLNVAYLEGVGVGEEVEVVAEMVKMGMRLAHVRGVMRRVIDHHDNGGGGGEGDGRVVATAEHGKVNVDRNVGSEEGKIRGGGGGGGGGNKSKL